MKMSPAHERENTKQKRPSAGLMIERVQTGVRVEKRILKVLKAFAELRDLTLSDLLEGIVLHAFDNKSPFSAESLKRIALLKQIYGLDLDASASHMLREKPPVPDSKKHQRSQ
jgi:predicted DNA-binding ribbon-helix-helix protein